MEEKIGIILGGNLEKLKFLKGAKEQIVKTHYGKSRFFFSFGIKKETKRFILIK